VNFPVVGVIHQHCRKFISGVKIKEKGDLKLNNSPDSVYFFTDIYGPQVCLNPKPHTQKRMWPISSHLDLTLSQ